MEPRARAGKNVGKMNFGYGELRQLLYGGGDARDPLPETMRVLDEIATDFIQSLSFEAARIGQYSGRQKIKYEDFEFALRRNPLFLGKVREMFEMSKEVKDARKMPGIGEGNMGKADINDLAKLGEGDEGGEGTNKNGEGPSASGAAASATPTSGTGRGKKRGPYAKTAGKRKKAKMEQEAAEAAAAEAAAATAKDDDGGVVNVKEEPADDTTQGTRGATADTADGAADEEPDAEEPSNLDALFGGGDDADADGDDDLGF
ncbi:hypothetical protein SPBR_01969 [Sporothrix brasiliensis 5110]|uniref:Transcription initiation factor TFIID subunit 13 n=1 Tax=Sporothrix brasiliensis 5110 TaxID=1398154 RepID=A0A0C2FK57_9PEZI|nr:uncharacterized protein SPBR_01969 [Sporothrix brasiliensis 5110]KIH91423.1 hypothetical protein SPBR_01969 [Sporothrix brasiliensis 5110]